MRGIRLEVVGHLVLGRVCIPRPGKRHAIEAVEAVRREQTERVPPLPPGIADACVRVDDDEFEAELLQVVADRQAGLTRADDDHADALPLRGLAQSVERLAFLDQALDPRCHWPLHSRPPARSPSTTLPRVRAYRGYTGPDFGKTTQ